MEDGSTFLWDCPAPNEEPAASIESNSFHEDVEDLFKELHGISVEELEVELRRKEKELYLCSKLGLFLAQEVDELVSQRRGIVSDHTRVLLELQEYRDSRRSYLDVSDGASERAGASNKGGNSASSSPDLPRNDIDGPLVDGKISSLHSQNNEAFFSKLHRTASLDSSLDAISNVGSTMTTASTRDLQNDLDLVQESHDKITKLEVQLDTTRAKYRSLMTTYSHKLKEMSRQLGSSVGKARPYFEAVKKAKKCQIATQQAAMEYKRAVNLHKAARDMVRVAEERVMSSCDKLDPTWQEMLNQANLKVNDASKEKNRVHQEHMKAAKAFQSAEDKKTDLQTKLQRSVIKSKPYFEIQKEFQAKLEAVTKKLNILELRLLEARQNYSHFLTRLRKSGSETKPSKAIKSLSERGMGVGAENPLGLPSAAGETLPKPALEFLEKESIPDGNSKANSDEMSGDLGTSRKTKLHYSPYDLLYLSEIHSDSGSNYDSEDDNGYIQDF
uniref:SH3 domain-binding protein 5-like n=1 Tax=Phallusia mammillata TaxID=59560 RepID=A0A6F9DRH3_9ASCI|nr:SH3 domain-binding protein 5-like [Phallusia mammillata]